MSIREDPRADRQLLDRFRFDAERWLAQSEAVRQGKASADQALLEGVIEPVTEVETLADEPSEKDADVRQLGEQALARGEVAMVVLNGGMATRFGGGVKGAVEVGDGKSFIALKLEDAARAHRVFGRVVPVVLMDSFATRDQTRHHLETHPEASKHAEAVLHMDQTISIRLEADGSPFVGNDGKFRYYAPGHGEFFGVLVASGVFAQLNQRGVRWLCFSNVDNLGATIDPFIIGHHIRNGRDMTVEVTAKRRYPDGTWDVGGAAVRVGGRICVVEGFRFPPSLRQATLPDIQTNNMVFSLGALADPLELPRYLVHKRVEGRDSLGFEAITCEASGLLGPGGNPRLSLSLLRVPRDGPRGRFFPVKSREDLERLRPQLLERVRAGWALREHPAAR